MKQLVNPVGTQIFGARYYFTESSLIESAEGMLKMGCEVIKFDLDPHNYPEYKGFSGRTLDALALEGYQRVLDMDFKIYVVWLHPSDWYGEGEAWEREVFDQAYETAKYLLERCGGSGKTFLLGNWEGDWLAQRCAYDNYAVASRADMDRMTKCFELRQRAVERARAETPHRDVRVAHYVEVNRVLGAIDMGLDRLANYVLPKLTVDAVSYSCYDANTCNRLSEALVYIESNAHFTDYLDGIFAKKVFVGEFDAFRDYLCVGGCAALEQRNNVDSVLLAALGFGAPLVLFWEYYNNEPSGVFKLVDEQGRRTHMYAHLVDRREKVERIDALFFETFGRPMTARDLSQLSYLIKMGKKELPAQFKRHKYVQLLEREQRN